MTIFDRNTLEESPFFIAEVGQNHQGDFELAKKYIIEFSRLGASAVKFQMRNMNLNSHAYIQYNFVFCYD